MKKILILAGGNSSEHKVSCYSANSILNNIDNEKYLVNVAIIDTQNNWYLYEDDADSLVDWQNAKHTKIDNIINFLKDYDTVFPIIHGTNGEDGRLQGMLDLFNIKYVGCKTLSSAVGMDKEFAKMIFAYLNIPGVPFISLNHDYDATDIINQLGLPLIVKPANGGSSIGISKANNETELITAIKEAKKYDQKVIVEKYIKMRELECAVLENDKLIVSEVGEIIAANEFYDYNAKYENSKSNTIIPADIDSKYRDQIKDYAKRAFQGINAHGLARIDFFLTDAGEIYLNEINTLPGFTTISMYPKLLMHSGLSYKELITELIESAN